jgi:anaerobic selenocysteine-containing dehydrogenase
LLVVDPRKSDIAKRAAIHLQPKPGEDVSILAGMLRVILHEELHDVAFVNEHVVGIDALRQAVAGFTPDYVAERAGIDAEQLVDAARTFARGRRGFATASTGPSMSGYSTLVEYLVLCLNTVCGQWMRAGQTVRNPPTVVSQRPVRAQATAPSPGYDLGEPLPASGLKRSAAGNPTAALPAEILSEGKERVRALISYAGNPAAAWPDQLTTVEALKALELLIQVDIKMSATAQLADYVVASKMCLEVPGFTAMQDATTAFYGAHVYAGFADPWAQYTWRSA